MAEVRAEAQRSLRSPIRFYLFAALSTILIVGAVLGASKHPKLVAVVVMESCAVAQLMMQFVHTRALILCK